MKPNAPIVLHPLVGQFVRKLSHNALKLLVKVGEEVFKANNRNISTTRRKDVKAAHVLINRERLCEQCGITEQQWEQSIKELDELDLLWIAGRNTLKLERYFMLSPNKHLVKSIVFYNRSKIPKTFTKEN